jgi:hypothetical protein
MKKLFVLLVLFFPLCCFGQFVVEDPEVSALLGELNTMVTTNQVQNSTEFVQQTATLKSTLEFMKETNEKLKKVNEYFNDIIYYTELVEKQLRILKSQIEYIAQLKKDGNITTEEIQQVNEIFGDLLKKSEKLLDLASSLLKDGKMEMNDHDRLEMIQQINEQMTDILCQVNITKRNFEYITKERELVNQLKNWDTK